MAVIKKDINIPLVEKDSKEYIKTKYSLNALSYQELISNNIHHYASKSWNAEMVYPKACSICQNEIAIYTTPMCIDRYWNPCNKIEDAFTLLFKLGQIEYCKWHVSDSYYHSKHVWISLPSSDMSGYKEGFRDAASWCINDDELPEHITRCILSSLGYDVETFDIYGIAKSMNKLGPEEKAQIILKTDKFNDKGIYDFIKSRYPDWLKDG